MMNNKSVTKENVLINEAESSLDEELELFSKLKNEDEVIEWWAKNKRKLLADDNKNISKNYSK